MSDAKAPEDKSEPHQPFFKSPKIRSLFEGKTKIWLSVAALLAFFSISGTLIDTRQFHVEKISSSSGKLSFAVFRGDGAIVMCQGNSYLPDGTDNFSCEKAGSFWP